LVNPYSLADLAKVKISASLLCNVGILSERIRVWAAELKMKSLELEFGFAGHLASPGLAQRSCRRL